MDAGQLAIVEQHSIEESLQILLAIEESRSGSKCLRDKLVLLKSKLAMGQLHVAVLGQMKRGKSSFINALLGAEVLPAGVLPVTAIITEIRFGSISEATIVYSTGDLRERVELRNLAKYITEEGNPGNKRQVAFVEVSYPSPLSEEGIVLVDTPGIGSTHSHNTRTTENYLKEVDAGIVVLSVDPPITDVEFQFVRDLNNQIPHLFFILNKTDTVSFDEIGKLANFLEAELDKLQIKSPETFALSARQALFEKLQAGRASSSSGLTAFEDRLRTFSSREKRQVLVRSVAMDALQIARTLKFATSIGIRANQMTADDLHRKRLAFDQLLERTRTSMRELQVLLHQRTADILASVECDLRDHVEAHLPEARQHLKDFQNEEHSESRRAFGILLEAFLKREVEAVFEKWRVQESAKIQTQLNDLSSRFVSQANDAVRDLEQIARALFKIPVEKLAINCPLSVESHLHYKVQRVFYSLDSFLLLLPSFLLRRIVLRKVHSNLNLLLDMNAGRVRYDYVERLQSSILQFEKDIQGAVSMIVETLQSSLYMPSVMGNGQREAASRLDEVIGRCTQLFTPLPAKAETNSIR